MNIKSKSMPLVVIFGRTNVGKSTLFNCLVEKKQALISKIEGTTRDSNINKVEWQGRTMTLVDTGGIIDLKYLMGKKKKVEDVEAKVQQQARDYLARADLILFLVDNKNGLLPQDKQMAMILKKDLKLKNKTLLVANKVDNIKQRANAAEFNKLALGEPIPISAANGSGTGDMLELIIKKIWKNTKACPPRLHKQDKRAKNISPPWRDPAKAGKTNPEPEEEPILEDKIKVCLIGKPNVGKSSLLNSLLGYERVIISPTPHTTREPQNTEITYKDKKITLIDTAGISRKGLKTKGLEKFGIQKSLAALKKSNIALLLIDINQDITHQDLKLVEEIVERRISFIIIANKWDLIEEKDTKTFKKYIYSKFPFSVWAPIHFTSALTKSKVDKVFDLILEIDEQRQIQISDSVLNKILNKIVKIHPPAKGKGTKHPRIYELKQVRSNPPKFEMRIGPKDNLHFSYVRFVENRLRDKFTFLGTPIGMRVIKNRQVSGKHEK